MHAVVGLLKLKATFQRTNLKLDNITFLTVAKSQRIGADVLSAAATEIYFICCYQSRAPSSLWKRNHCEKNSKTPSWFKQLTSSL